MYLWPKSSKQQKNNPQNSDYNNRPKNESDHLCKGQMSTIICGNAAVEKCSNLRLRKSSNNYPQAAQLAEQINSIDEFYLSSEKSDWRYNRQYVSCPVKQSPCCLLRRYENNMNSTFPVDVINTCSRSSICTPNIHDCSGDTKLNDHLNGEEEDQKYAKFIYNITEEIVQRNLYSDKELNQVFKKHIEMNGRILNINKMAREIYQLKTSLNVPGDWNADEEIEELINAQKSMTVCENKEATFQQILDNGKTNDVGNTIMSTLGNKRDSITQTECFSSGVLLVDSYTEPLRPMLSRLYQGHYVGDQEVNAINDGITVCVPADTARFGLGKLPLSMNASRKSTRKNVRTSQPLLINELYSPCDTNAMKLGKNETLTIKTLLPNGCVAGVNECPKTMACCNHMLHV